MKTESRQTKKHRIEVSLSEDELKFCLNRAATTHFKLPTHYLRSLLLEQMQPHSGNEAERKFGEVLKQMSRIEEGVAQAIEAAQLISVNVFVARGYVQSLFDLQPEDIRRSLVAKVQKVIDEQKNKLTQIFSPKLNEQKK